MNIVVLTGAGISAESGLGTFRDKDGLWTRYRIEDVATPEAYARNPALVHEFYNLRRQGLRRRALLLAGLAGFALANTVTTLSNEVEKSKGYIARAEGQAQAAKEARTDNPLLSAIEG